MTTPESVYVIEWPGVMVKVGYSSASRWRSLATRHSGQVRGVWHFPSASAALDAEALALASTEHWGECGTADALDGRGGYLECRLLRGTGAVIAEVRELLDACGTRCTDPEWCGRLASECVYANARSNARSIRLAMPVAMHERNERTNAAGGTGRRQPFGSTARENRAMK